MSFRPSRDLRAQSGSSTPNPAPDSSGAVPSGNGTPPRCPVRSRRAPGRAASVQLGEQPGGPAQPGQQFLLRVGDPARGPAAAPAQTSAAGIIRLGSSVDWSANSTRQCPREVRRAGPLRLAPVRSSWYGVPARLVAPAPPLTGSISRKQVRTGPAGRCAAACQASSPAASSVASASSSAVAPSTPASGPVSAAAQRSATGMRADPTPAAGGSRPRLRAALQPVPCGGVGERIQRGGQDRTETLAGGRPRGTPPASPRPAGARVASAPVSTGRQAAAQH